MNPFLSQEQIQNLNNWLHNFNEQLIAQRITKEELTYWETLGTNPKNRSESYYTVDTTLYKGNGGIILYLLSMYEYAKEEKYLELAKQATEWLLQEVQNQEGHHFALYTGKTGVCYVLSEFYEVTHQSYYLETAVKLILQNQVHFIDHYSDDLLSGNAGNMLVIAQLYQQTGNAAILNLLLKCLDNLIDTVYLSQQGFKWRYRPNFIDSLCGLSHGAAGIGFVLTEMGNALNAPGLIWLGKQAFEYENQYYMPSSVSWPDFRIHPKKLEHPESVSETEKLMQGEEVSGWAHGSVGIALTRLRAFLYTGEETYRKQVEAVANHIIELSNESNNFSLTNGYGADAYLLACAGYHLNKDHYIIKAYKIIQRAMQIKAEYGYLPSGWDVRKPDLSVFMGETGLACCILQLLHPDKAGSVILPTLENREIVAIRFLNQEEIIKKIFCKYFPQTTNQVNKLPAIPNGVTLYQFFKNLGNEIPISFFGEDSINKEIFDMEKRKMELEVRPCTFSFLSDCYKSILNKKVPFTENARFVLHEFTELRGSTCMLVKYRYGVLDFKLSPFSLALIKLLSKQAKTIYELSNELQQELTSARNDKEIRRLIIKQLNQLYINGIIRQVE